jgi:hypothetical protein
VRSRKNRPSTELAAQAVESLAAPATHDTARAYQAVVSAISPAVFPTEQWRQDTKDAMLREFRRPRTEGRADAGSLDGTELEANVVRVETGAGSVTLADMEAISDDRAAAAAETVARIVARHDDRSRLS